MQASQQEATPGVAAREKAKPWDFLMVCTSVYIVTAVARVHQLYQPLEALKPLIIFSGLGLIVYLLDKQRVRRFGQLLDPTSKAATFLVTWTLVGVPFAMVRGRTLLYFREEVFPVGVLFLLVAGAVRDLTDVKRLVWVYSGGIVWLALTALARRHAGFRLGGPSYDANDLGMVLVSAIPIGIYALTLAKGTKAKLFAVASLVILAMATVNTDSRGAFLALCGVIIYTLFFLEGVKKTWRLGAAGAVFGFLALTASGSYWNRIRTTFDDTDYNQTSLTGRKKIWGRGMGYMFSNPVFGVGGDNFAAAEGTNPIILARQSRGQGTKWSTAHSSWVQIGAELGIPGFVALIIFYLGGIRRLLELAKRLREKGIPQPLREGAALAGALAGVLVGLLVAGTFVSQGFGYAVWAAGGLVAGLLKVMRFHRFHPGPG